MRTVRSLLRGATLLLLAVSTAACSKSTSDRDLAYLRPSEAVEMANTPMGALGSDGLPKVFWLDPRTEKEFEAAHIAKARSLPFPEIEKTHEVSCKGFDLFIVYDTDYDDVMAKAAAKRLMELGYRKVYNIRGGLKAWKADGYPIESGKTPAESGKTPAESGKTIE